MTGAECYRCGHNRQSHWMPKCDRCKCEGWIDPVGVCVVCGRPAMRSQMCQRLGRRHPECCPECAAIEWTRTPDVMGGHQ